MTPANILVTSLDRGRVLELIDRASLHGPVAAASPAGRLSQALRAAVVVAPTDIPRQVATLHSRVIYRTGRSRQTTQVRTVTLVTPSAADPVLGRESVLSPTGSALLGLTEGQSVEQPDDAGCIRRYTLLKVIFQPEAAGRFDL